MAATGTQPAMQKLDQDTGTRNGNMLRKRSRTPLRRRSSRTEPEATEERAATENGNEDFVGVSFRLKEAVHKPLKRFCFVTGISQNDFVTEAIEEHLRKAIKTVAQESNRAFIFGE